MDADRRDARGDERGDDISFSPNARLSGVDFLSTWVEEDHPFGLLLLLLLLRCLLLAVLLLTFVPLLLSTLPALAPGRGSVRCLRPALGEGASAPDNAVECRLGNFAATASSGEVFLIGLCARIPIV